jgi:hypothetical protein
MNVTLEERVRARRQCSIAGAGVALCSLFVLLALAGCATLEVATGEQLHGQRFSEEADPVAHIYVDNWGLYILGVIPFVTGNLSNPARLHLPVLFTDNVRVDLMVEKVTAEGLHRGGTILTDLRTRDRSYWMWWTLVFWLRELEVSANASRPPGVPEKP